MTGKGTKAVRHWPFIAFLVLYGAVLCLQLDHGLESLDAHGIIDATHALVENHVIEVSRPPGHPTTELYVFGAVGWIAKYGFGRKFDDKTYLVLQGTAALATLAVFYELLCRIVVKAWRAFLATVCLAFSAQYFPNAIDGEEFIFALFFVLLAIRLLIDEPDAPIKPVRQLLSIFCFALATGCRPEAIVTGVIYPIYCLLHPKLGWKWALATLPLQAAAIAVVWLPILLTELRAPYAAGMNLRESILGGGYKLIFQCFTVPVFVLLCWILSVAVRTLRRRVKQPFPSNFIFAISCLIPLIFFPLFFGYATKPAYILVALPFLLMLAAESSKTWLLGLTALILLGCLVNVDIFRDRRLARPFLVPGSCLQAIRQKPFYKLGYLRLLLAQCEERSTVIISDAWRWDFDYHIARGNLFVAKKELLETKHHDVVAFFPQRNAGCIILPRDGALRSDLLENWQTRGYVLKMDAVLYRTFFTRYDVLSSLGNSARVGPLSFNLFSIKSSSP